MPNWCSNDVIVQGSKEELLKFDAQFKKNHRNLSGGTAHISASRLGTDEHTEELKSYLHYRIVPKGESAEVHYVDKAEWEEGYSFQNFVPMTPADFVQGWHPWASENWGTKWDMGDAHCNMEPSEEALDELQYSFSTAWAPAEPVVLAMSQQYPNLTFIHIFEESGCEIAGEVTYDAGEEMERNEPDSDDQDGYYRFLRDHVGRSDISECESCKKLYDDFSIDEDEDGDGICPHCEASIPKAS